MFKILVLVWAVLLSAVAAFANLSALVEWDAVTTADLAGYKIYRGLFACSATTTRPLLASATKTQTSYTDASIPDGTLVASYRISAVDTSGNESEQSQCVEKTFAAPVDPLEARVTAVEKKNVEQDASLTILQTRVTALEQATPPTPTTNITSKNLNTDQIEVTGLNCLKLTTSGTGLRRIITCSH